MTGPIVTDIPELVARLVDNRFDGLTDEDLAREVEKFRGGAGTGSIQGAVEALRDIAAALADTDRTLREELGKLGVHWRSQAGTQAGSVLTEQAGFSQQAKEKVDHASELIYAQGEAFTRTRNKLPEPQTLRDGKDQLLLNDALRSLIGFEDDQVAGGASAREARQQAIEALNAYAAQSGSHLAAAQSVEAPGGLDLEQPDTEGTQSPVLEMGGGLFAPHVQPPTAPPAGPDVPSAPTHSAQAACPPSVPVAAAPAAPAAVPAPTAPSGAGSFDPPTPPMGTALPVPGRGTGSRPSTPDHTTPSALPRTPSGSAPHAPGGMIGGVVPPPGSGRPGAGRPGAGRPGPIGGEPGEHRGVPGRPGETGAVPGRPATPGAPGFPGGGTQPGPGGSGGGPGGFLPAPGVPGGQAGQDHELAKGRQTGSGPQAPAGTFGGPVGTGPMPGKGGISGTDLGAAAVALGAGAGGAGAAVTGERDRARGYGRTTPETGRKPSIGDLPGDESYGRKREPAPPRDKSFMEKAAPADDEIDREHVRRYGVDDKDLFADPRAVTPQTLGSNVPPDDE